MAPARHGTRLIRWGYTHTINATGFAGGIYCVEATFNSFLTISYYGESENSAFTVSPGNFCRAGAQTSGRHWQQHDKPFMICFMCFMSIGIRPHHIGNRYHIIRYGQRTLYYLTPVLQIIWVFKINIPSKLFIGVIFA